VIIGARKLSQFQANLASFDLMLSADQLKTLDEASQIELGFPYDMYAKAMFRAMTYGVPSRRKQWNCAPCR
jgi:hypothetical protein